MSVIQSNYSETHTNGRNGQIASSHSFDADSYRVEGDNIPFGRACKKGTADDQTSLGVAAGNFVGVSVMDRTLPPEQNDQYKVGNVASMMIRGDIFIRVARPVAAGDNVVADLSTGELSSADTDEVGEVNITNKGTTAYGAVPTVAFTGGGGTTQATGVVVLDADGFVARIDILTAGVGYTAAPTVTITAAAGDNGAGATATATLAAATTRLIIPGAKWMTSAGGGAMAVLRLSGEQVSA